MKITRKILSASFIFASLAGINAYGGGEVVPLNEGIPTWQDEFNSGGGSGGTVYSQNVVGYVNYGAGFLFSPNVSMSVTALGYGTTAAQLSSYPFTVSLFDAGGNQLATATVTTSDSFNNQSYYQNITPVNLVAGNMYYLQSVEYGSTTWVGDLSNVFTPNADINYVSASDGGFGAAPASMGNPGLYLEAPNFEFQVVPEPSVACLGLAGLLGLAWRRSRG